MTERTKAAIKYFQAKLDKTYTNEADFLMTARQFLDMLDNLLVIRESLTTENGTADLIICYEGKFIACELKRVDGKASYFQERFIQKVKNAGGEAAICRTLRDILKLLQITEV